jgi:hypothetical protein
MKANLASPTIFQKDHFGEYSNLPKMANFWRVLEFAKFAGELPLLNKYTKYYLEFFNLQTKYNNLIPSIAYPIHKKKSPMCEKRNPTMIFATDFFFSTKTLYLCFLIFLSTIFAIFAIFNYSDLLEQIVPTAKHENVVNRFFLFAIDYYDLVLIEVNRLIVTLAHRPKLK